MSVCCKCYARLYSTSTQTAGCFGLQPTTTNALRFEYCRRATTPHSLSLETPYENTASKPARVVRKRHPMLSALACINVNPEARTPSKCKHHRNRYARWLADVKFQAQHLQMSLSAALTLLLPLLLSHLPPHTHTHTPRRTSCILTSPKPSYLSRPSDSARLAIASLRSPSLSPSSTASYRRTGCEE